MTVIHPLRSHNRSRLMHLLLERGVLSRSELAAELNLSKVTATAIVGGLLEEGWLRAPGKTEGTAGRPAGLVELHPHAGTVLGVDVQPEGISLCGGTLVARGGAEPEHHALERPEHANRALLEILERVYHAAPHGPLRQGVLALPAPVGPGGLPSHPNRLPELELAPLLAWAERHRVVLSFENDVKLAALAEFERGAAQGHPDFALLVEREGGVALGLFLEGRLYRGAQGNAGELALIGWPQQGGVVPLEQLPLEVREQALAQVCSALSVALDLRRFLIHQSSGGVQVLDVSSRISELVLRPIEVLGSRFGDAGPMQGALLQAARLAQQRLFGPEIGEEPPA